jgi:hypothetical protein
VTTAAATSLSPQNSVFTAAAWNRCEGIVLPLYRFVTVTAFSIAGEGILFTFKLMLRSHLMKTGCLIIVCTASMVLASLRANAAFNDDHLVRAGTPEATQVMSRLAQARHVDRMNAQGYMGAANRDAGLFYYKKTVEIDELLKQLRRGEAVPMSDVQSALNNSDAARYGGSF